MKVEIDSAGKVELEHLCPGDTFIDHEGSVSILTDIVEPSLGCLIGVDLDTGGKCVYSEAYTVTPIALKVVRDD